MILIALAHTLIALAHTLIALAYTSIALTHFNNTEKLHGLCCRPNFKSCKKCLDIFATYDFLYIFLMHYILLLCVCTVHIMYCRGAGHQAQGAGHQAQGAGQPDQRAAHLRLEAGYPA